MAGVAGKCRHRGLTAGVINNPSQSAEKQYFC